MKRLNPATNLPFKQGDIREANSMKSNATPDQLKQFAEWVLHLPT